MILCRVATKQKQQSWAKVASVVSLAPSLDAAQPPLQALVLQPPPRAGQAAVHPVPVAGSEVLAVAG